MAPPLDPRHWHYQRAGGLLALLLALSLGVSGCEAHANYDSAPGQPAAQVGETGLIVREDSARGVVCYQAAYRAGFSCVKVRP